MAILSNPTLAEAQARYSKTLSKVYHGGMLVVWVGKGFVDIGPESLVCVIDHRRISRFARFDHCDIVPDEAGSYHPCGHSHLALT